MTTRIQLRRGTKTQHNSFTGATGEVTVNTTDNSLHVHDGTTQGGFPAAKSDLANVSGAINLSLSGITTTGSLSIGSTQVISSARQLQNIVSLDATTTATIESAIASGPNDFNSLNVSGVSTFSGITTHTASLFGTQASFSGVVTATAGTITTLNSTNGTITNLTGTSGTITTFNSTNGTITNLTGTAGTITTFNSTEGTITNLTGTAGTITTLNSTNGTITNLTGTSGTITTFNSTNGTITNLTGTAGTITTLNSTNGTITNLSSTNINASGIVTATSGFVGALTGLASSATQLATGRTVAITGDIAYTSGSFDGTGNVTGTGTLATVNGNIGTFGSQTLIPVVTVNAKGLVTAVTTAAVGTALTVSGDSGSVDINLLDEILTISGGTNLTSVGSGNTVTVNLDPNISLTSIVVGSGVTINASGIIASAGIITATTFVGALTGTASNVTTNANLTGDITSSGNATSIASGVIVNDDINASAGIVDTKLATISTAGKVSNSATTATDANTNNAIVSRDASGNFSAGIITATQLSTGASGTGVNITTNTISGPSILTIDPAAVGDDTGAVRIKGDLYVDGTQFIVNSTTIELADFNVGIATTVGTNDLLDGAGIGIGSTSIRKTLTWSNSSTALKSSEDFDVASGKVYKIAGTSVLSNNTLGSGVETSSLTSVGTLGSLSVGNVNSTGIITATTFVGALTGTATSTTNIPNLTGDITSVNSVTSIADDVIIDADIKSDAAIAVSKLAASTISGIILGNNLNALTISTGLSGSSYNGSGVVTIAIDSTVATLTGTQTLTNKTLTSPTLTAPVLGAATATSVNASGIITANSYDIGTAAGISTTITTGITTTAATAIDSFSTSTYRSSKMQIQITQGTDYQASDVLVIHNGTIANIIEYGSIATNDYLGTFNSSVSDGNCLLSINMISATSATVKVLSQRITI